MKTHLRVIGFSLFIIIGLSQIGLGQCITAKYASLPYTQTFNSWITLCDSIDSLNVPDSSWINIPVTGNDSWRRDDQGSTAGWGVPDAGVYYPASPIDSFSARFHSSWSNIGSMGTLNLYLNCNTSITTQQLNFYYINEDGVDSMVVSFSTNGGTTFQRMVGLTTTLSGWIHDSVTFTSSSPTTIICFAAVADDGGSDIGLAHVQVKTLPLCSAKPTAGQIVATFSTFCYGFVGDSLTLSGNPLPYLGLSYQWQQSTNNTTWSTIAGDTTPVIFVSPFTLTYYRAIVICNGSGLSDTTAVVNINSVGSFFRTIPYTQNFESWINNCNTLDVPDTGWINIPSSGNDSWRRDDEGYDAGWTYVAGGVYSPSSDSGSHSARFHASQTPFYTTTGTLNLYVNCSTVKGTKQLSFYYINPDGRNFLNVYVSTNGGVTFGPSLLTCPGAVLDWTYYTVPITSDSAATVISFVGSSLGNGLYDMGLDLVQVLSPCQDKPVAGDIVTQTTCHGDSLSLLGASANGGLSYLWQQSIDSINWNTIGGEDTTPVITVIPFNTTYYRAIVICNGSGLSDTTAKVKVAGNGSFYRKIPYTQNFESWINNCSTLDVPDTGWLNIPSYGYDSWRRNDQGALGGWGSNYNQYYPQSYSGSYSAELDVSGTTATGTLDLYVNCSTVKGTKELSFYCISEATSLNVYVSTDGGATFGPSLVTAEYDDIWTKYLVPINSDSAATVISFVGTGTIYNDANLGLDLVQVIPPCQGKPIAGNIITFPGCSIGDSLVLSGTSQTGGLSYVWQQSIDSITWSTIAKDTSTSISVSFGTTTYYRAVVTCTNSGLSDTTAKVKVNGMPASFYRSIPYTQNFESWINHCDSLDVPDTGWLNIPSYGYDSWRRNDQGITAGWNCPSCGAYNPSSYPSGDSYSACFYAIGANSGSTGTLELYVNCGTVKGTKLLNFYYINPDQGNDSMNVYVSMDGGATFGPSLLTCPSNTINWRYYTLPITSDSARTVISFTATADNGGTYSYDMGLDLVQVLPPCQGKPTAGQVSAIPSSICGSETSIISLAGENAGSYQWQSSPDSVNWSNLIGDTLMNFIASPIASTYYRCIVTCQSSGLSDTSNKFYLHYSPNCYCPPQSTYESGDNIGNVTITYGTTTILDNGVDTPAINPNVDNTQIYYANYVDSPQLVVNLTQGYTYNISTDAITDALGGEYPDTAYVYIDYNIDGEWESNERVWSAPYKMPFSNTPIPVSGTFTVPLTADTGITEMRIQLSSQAGVITPCYNGENEGGETEDYLVHIAPVPPCSDIPTAGNVEPASDTLCTGSSVIFNLENSSVATGLSYQWQSSFNNSSWTNITGSVNNQLSISFIASTIYYRCQVTCSNSGQSAYSTSAYVYINSQPAIPTAKNDTICGAGNSLLSVNTGSGNYYWFTSSDDSLPVHSGSSYSPYVTKDKTYYVSSATSSSAYCTVGYDSLSRGFFSYPGCSTFSSSGQYNAPDTGLAGLVFNANNTVTLTGVFIFPQYAGTFYIYLLNASGVKLDSALATVTSPQFANPYWIPLNFSVSAGTGYQLVAKVSDVNCMADEDNRSAFPFTDCNNAITITAGTADGIQNQTYYFFYKWVINQGCESDKIPVSVYVTTPPSLSVTVSPNNGYSCNGLPYRGTLLATGNYTSFIWSPTTGLNSLFGNKVSVTADTSITYTVTATNGTCNNTASITVNVEPKLIFQVSPVSAYTCAGEPVQLTSSLSQPILSYCIPPLPGDCNEYMSVFNFDNISINNSTCPGYVYYTDTAFVQAGNTYDISIIPSQNTNPYGFGVWIDYNQNGVFTDSSELAFIVPSQTFSGSQFETGTITIPSNALHGYTRMRIINFLNNTPDLYSSECGLDSLYGNSQTNIGSIEDFTVDVTNNDKFTYNWSPGTDLSGTSISNPIAAPTVSTTYNLIMTNSISGCADTGLMNIYVSPAPYVDIYVPQDTLCSGQSETLDAGADFVSYLWSTGDTTETITVNSAGKYSVTVTAQNECVGYDTINIVIQICSGINDVDAGNYSIGVYPNPFNNQFMLELNGLPTGEFVFDMTNTLGQNVLEFKDQNATTLYKRDIDLHELPPGMYYISILLNGKNYVKQIIKTN